MAVAIIVAAGSGQRFGGDVPKQFRLIKGEAVISHTIRRFDECPHIDSIVLVVSGDRLAESQVFVSKFEKLKKVVGGGSSRADSVLNGLNSSEASELVAVHDGARPLVSTEEISATVIAAGEFGAACLVTPVSDTIKRVEGNKIVETIDRASLRRAATPQCFQTEILQNAFAKTENFAKATDECALVERQGQEIHIVEGSSRNIKITFEDDLRIAEALL